MYESLYKILLLWPFLRAEFVLSITSNLPTSPISISQYQFLDSSSSKWTWAKSTLSRQAKPKPSTSDTSPTSGRRHRSIHPKFWLRCNHPVVRSRHPRPYPRLSIRGPSYLLRRRQQSRPNDHESGRPSLSQIPGLQLFQYARAVIVCTPFYARINLNDQVDIMINCFEGMGM